MSSIQSLLSRRSAFVIKQKNMQTHRNVLANTLLMLYSCSLTLSHTYTLDSNKNVITFLTWSRCFHSSAHSLSVSLWSMTSSWRVLPCIPDTRTRERERASVKRVTIWASVFHFSCLPSAACRARLFHSHSSPSSWHPPSLTHSSFLTCSHPSLRSPVLPAGTLSSSLHTTPELPGSCISCAYITG